MFLLDTMLAQSAASVRSWVIVPHDQVCYQFKISLESVTYVYLKCVTQLQCVCVLYILDKIKNKNDFFRLFFQ